MWSRVVAGLARGDTSCWSTKWGMGDLTPWVSGERAPSRRRSLPFAQSLSKGESESVLLDAVPAHSNERG